MKKWQIITVSIVAAFGVLAGGGAAFYKYYLEPKYMEPVAEKVTEYLQDDNVLESLYEDTVRLHDEGVIDDETYSDFIRKYKAHVKESEQSEEEARAILEEKEKSSNESKADSKSLTAKYASNRVGVRIVETNDDDEAEGKSAIRYSSERTSDRLKAEDVVAAEKVIAEADEEKTAGSSTFDEDDTASAKESLAGEGSSFFDESDTSENTSSGGDSGKSDKTASDSDSNKSDSSDNSSKASKVLAAMTNEDRAAALEIMGKIDVSTAEKLYKTDQEELKSYLKSVLSESEYNQAKVLMVKYATVLLGS